MNWTCFSEKWNDNELGGNKKKWQTIEEIVAWDACLGN